MSADVPADRLTEETAARILELVGRYEAAVTDAADALLDRPGEFGAARERREAAYKDLSDTVLALVDWPAITAAKVAAASDTGEIAPCTASGGER